MLIVALQLLLIHWRLYALKKKTFVRLQPASEARHVLNAHYWLCNELISLRNAFMKFES